MMTVKKSETGSRLVYSTETGRVCPDCGQPIAACTCKQNAKAVPAGDGIVRVSLATKGRKGKGVTVIKGVPLDAAALSALGKQLKANCGSGGTTKDGVIEIQGDHRDTVIAALQKQGMTVKRAGG
ncbi:MAG: translation initiation factor Sui1 [Comamonadaceae bacterium]|nr:MAG: translation initiation factor Sui1 [Comamonadaceae bacterium]